MNLAAQLLQRIDDLTLSYVERARLRCQLAKELEEAGNYEAAHGALGGLWQRIGERPQIENLDLQTAAEVLLCAGLLTGRLGSIKQIAGAQETAKDLVSESNAIFKSLGLVAKAAEAQIEMAHCYWREGSFDEARIMLQDVLSHLTDEDNELKAKALLRYAVVERSANRFNDCLHTLNAAAPLSEASNSHIIRGNFHNTRATVVKNLSAAEQREDYIDRALVEYAAASFHFEQAGHLRFMARVENNLGHLFSIATKFTEAYDHLNRARRLFANLKDSGSVAQVDETRAKVLLAEGRDAEAEKVARSAVRTLEQGGEQSLLAEALTTYGTALVRLKHYQQARLTLQRAIEVA